MTPEIAIFESAAGQIDVRLEADTVWLNQAQLARLFARDRTVIGRHLHAIFAEGELEEASNVQKMHIPPADKPTVFYNLDVIISVGYRVKSREGVRFRQWATRVLKNYLTRGYALDRERLRQNAQELEAALQLVRRTLAQPDFVRDTGSGLADIVVRYTQTFLWLQAYDERLLSEPSGTPGGALPTLAEARSGIARLKDALIGKGQASALFGQERGDGLAAILGNLDQSVFGEAAYPTLEARAANLLYFIIKDHPFADGNKRIGAFLFAGFLHGNARLFNSEGVARIDDVSLAALALLVAQSKAAEKDVLIRLIMHMLAEGG